MTEDLKNMQDFEIEDDTVNTVIDSDDLYDPLEGLVNHDFSSDDDINLDESYELISHITRENTTNKALEAENIIEELGDTYLNQEYSKKLNNSFNNIKSFIRKYNIEDEIVKKMTKLEKTRLYGIGSFLSKNVGSTLNDLLFDITLTREEYKFLDTALTQKLTYDGNEVFNIVELNNRYLKEWKKIDKSLPKNVPSFVVNIDIKNIVMLYHFLGKYSVKGLNKEFYIFGNLLQKIANTNKLYNSYNVLKERIDIEFSIWTSAMDDNEPTEDDGYKPGILLDTNTEGTQ